MTTELAMVLWVVAFAALLHQAWYGKAPVAGLAVCYWLNLAAYHLVTEGLCLFYRNTSPYRSASEYGFPLTGYALLGLMVGSLLLARPLSQLFPGGVAEADRPPAAAASTPMALAAILAGLLIFLVGNILNIPSLSAVMGGGNVLAAGGFAWWWWTAYRGGRRFVAWCILAGSLAVPALTLIFYAFLGTGIVVLFTLAAFVLVRFRPRFALLIAAAPVLYLGLSACVTYLYGRSDIRQSVWREQASLAERARVIQTVFDERWQWFDPTDDRQRLLLDERFDQNYFVGLTAARIGTGETDYVQGESVKNAVLALVPRIVWRDKPVFMGGTEQMAQYTGLQFSSKVTFGLGHVLESYVNYGAPGLVLCFTVLGAAIGVVDLRAGQCLRAGRLDAFLLWFVPGQALMNSGVGNFAEITGGLAGSLVLTWMFLWVFRRVARAAPAPPPVGHN